MPVVTPSAASIDTVKFVRRSRSVSLTISGRRSCRQRSRVQRQADQAAPVARHEVDVLGTDELRRNHQVALVLAVLVVHDDDHPAMPDVLQQLVDRIQV